MTGTIEIGVALAVAGLLIGAFWKVWGLIGDAKKEALERASHASSLATLTQTQLQEHKLHVAETYTTKAGMSEQTDRIMQSIEGVGEKLDHTNSRLDSLMLQQTASPHARGPGV